METSENVETAAAEKTGARRVWRVPTVLSLGLPLVAVFVVFAAALLAPDFQMCTTGSLERGGGLCTDHQPSLFPRLVGLIPGVSVTTAEWWTLSTTLWAVFLAAVAFWCLAHLVVWLRNMAGRHSPAS